MNDRIYRALDVNIRVECAFLTQHSNGQRKKYNIIHFYVCITRIPSGTLSKSRGNVVCAATHYGLDVPGFEPWWGARFSGPIHTLPNLHPGSSVMNTGFVSWG